MQKSIFRTLAMLSAAGVSMAGTAQAQDDPVGAAPASPAQLADEAPARGEIVVTAERRETSLQAIPLAVSVVSSDQLVSAGVTEARDLSKLAPTLFTMKIGMQQSYLIRGAGSVVLGPFADPAVSINLDGVYIARPYGAAAPFFDLERVEILKGPQGTLYGRNATAGAVNYITKKPVFDNAARVDLEVGNYGRIRTGGFVNAMLSDTVAVRGAVQISRRDGYTTDGYENEKTDAARMHLLFRPSEGTSLLLSGDYASARGKGSAYLPFPFRDPNNPRLGPSTPQIAGLFAATPLTGYGQRGFVDVLNWGVSAQLDQDLGDFATLTALGAFRKSDFAAEYYPGNLIGQPDNTSDQYSAELRLASNTPGPLEWIVGGYFFDEKTRSRNLLMQQDRGTYVDADTFTGPSPLIVRGSDNYFDPVADRQWAAFGQATYSVLDWVRLTLGGRYTYEVKSKSGSSVLYSAAFPGGSAVIPEVGRLAVDKFNYKVGVELDMTPSSMLYAHLSTGIKAGGFISGAEPSAVNPTPNTFRPENVRAIVVGMKNRLFDNRVTLNVEGYHYKVTDRQYTTFVFYNTGAVGNGIGQGVVNTELATIYGFEANLNVRVGTGGMFTAGFDYLPKAEATKMVFRQSFLTNACPTIAPQTYDCSGRRLPYSPKLVGTASYEHNFDLANGGVINGRISAQYKSKVSSAFVPTFLDTIESYVVADTALGYTAPEERFRVELFVNNVFDKLYRTTALGVGPIFSMGELGPPRTFGVRGSVNF